MEKILTISVATYNLGNMIEDNLKSFINLKNLEDIEVLVIDDGSTDNTTKIAEKYQEAYPNSIKIIRQKNSGPGSTVNTGIKNATGKYFKMIDGDDWVKTSDMDRLIDKLKEINDVDAFITNDLVYSEKDTDIIKKIKFEYPKEQVVFGLNIDRPIIGMHSIGFRTSILKENDIKLDNGFYTDVEYLLYPIAFIKTIIYFDLDVYVYRVGRMGQSVSYKSLKKNIQMHDLVLTHIMKYYEEKKDSMNSENKLFIQTRIADMVQTKITLILAFEQLSTVKSKCEEFLNNLKKEHNDIYNVSISTSRINLLIKSKFYLAIIYAIYLKFKVFQEK